MPKLIESIQLEYCTISLREDGIIEQRFTYEDPYTITARDLKEFDINFKKLCINQRRCILSIPGLYGSMTTESRKVDVFSDTGHTIAVGLIIKSLSQRLLANFFFKINKVPYPVKFFKAELDATVWLLEENQKSFSNKAVG